VDQLANIFWTFGEERRSRAIARAIGEARAVQPVTRTLELADICTRIAGRQDGAAHPATRTFQA
ncbi:MAG TPA: 16S rRNA (cytosine(1402)-N(4))-methyltransferase, partial [Alphaproteobacteria bacterium]|nr:16S rRNA (cytosine(1402)-N(4))-methyltransferase [Alphaproteobacteria bacterium]